MSHHPDAPTPATLGAVTGIPPDEALQLARGAGFVARLLPIAEPLRPGDEHLLHVDGVALVVADQGRDFAPFHRFVELLSVALERHSGAWERTLMARMLLAVERAEEGRADRPAIDVDPEGVALADRALAAVLALAGHAVGPAAAKALARRLGA